MFLAVIINRSSDLTKKFHKISLFKVLWNITRFSISRAIMIYLIPFIIFGNYGEICHLKGFSVLIFPFNYIDLSYNIPNDIDKVIRNNLKIKFNFHSLRHTHATILIENGANPVNVAERLGHTNIETFAYTHNTLKMQAQSIDILADVVIL